MQGAKLWQFQREKNNIVSNAVTGGFAHIFIMPSVSTFWKICDVVPARPKTACLERRGVIRVAHQEHYRFFISKRASSSLNASRLPLQRSKTLKFGEDTNFELKAMCSKVFQDSNNCAQTSPK